MEKIISDIELIERFHNDQLSITEKEDFKKRFKNDPDFQQLYQHHIRFLMDSESARYSFLKNQLQTVDQSLPVYNEKRKSRWLIPLSIAASLIIFVAGYFLIYPPKSNLDKLLSKYEKLEKGGIVLMNNQNEINLTNSYNSFRDSEYKKALDYLYLLPDSPEKNYYSGINHYFLKQIDSSVYYLNRVDTSKEDLSIKANFYLALSFIKEKNYSKARLILKNLQQQQTSLETMIKELLAKLPKE